jgi:hypothetical protein
MIENFFGLCYLVIKNFEEKVLLSGNYTKTRLRIDGFTVDCERVLDNVFT